MALQPSSPSARMRSPPTLCASDDGGLVVSLAMQAGVPTETLGTVLLLSAVLFACRKGGAILHALGVLLLSAALTLYALGRRVRRRLAAAPRVCAALAAFGGVLPLSAGVPPCRPRLCASSSARRRASLFDDALRLGVGIAVHVHAWTWAGPRTRVGVHVHPP